MFLHPLNEIVKLVAESREAGLNRARECNYAGLKLLFSLMRSAGREVASSIDEANVIFRAGAGVADRLWGLLDRGVDQRALSDGLQQHLEWIWSQKV